MHSLILVQSAVLLISLSLSNGAVDYHTFVQCKPSIISAIKAYWLLSGTPTDVLSKVDGKGFTLLKTSYDYKNDDSKCMYIDVGKGEFNVTLIPNNGTAPNVLPFTVTQGDDGVLSGGAVENDKPEHKYKLYTLSLTDDTWAYYVCSDYEKGTEKLPLAAIVVKDGARAITALSSAVNPLSSVLSGMSFDLKHSYGAECFRNSPSEVTSPTASSGLSGLVPKPNIFGKAPFHL